MPAIDDLDNDEVDEAPKISMINFAYNNARIINQLKTRGNYIKAEQWNKLRQLNTEMCEQFLDLSKKQELLDSVQRPVTCFITFENEEGKSRAEEYNDITEAFDEFEHYRTLLGEPINIVQAPEPSDILWENRHYTPGMRAARTYAGCFILLLILFGSFIFIYLGT